MLDAILTRELLNLHVIAPKLDLNPLLKLITYQDLDQYLKLIKHKIISKLNFIS